MLQCTDAICTIIHVEADFCTAIFLFEFYSAKSCTVVVTFVRLWWQKQVVDKTHAPLIWTTHTHPPSSVSIFNFLTFLIFCFFSKTLHNKKLSGPHTPIHPLSLSKHIFHSNVNYTMSTLSNVSYSNGPKDQKKCISSGPHTQTLSSVLYHNHHPFSSFCGFYKLWCQLAMLIFGTQILGPNIPGFMVMHQESTVEVNEIQCNRCLFSMSHKCFRC